MGAYGFDLLSKYAGKNNTEISVLMNGMHHSSIGRLIAGGRNDKIKI
jgi:hypothetical protein